MPCQDLIILGVGLSPTRADEEIMQKEEEAIQEDGMLGIELLYWLSNELICGFWISYVMLSFNYFAFCCSVSFSFHD